VEVIPIQISDQDARALTLLSPGEMDRASRFLRPEPRRSFVAGRAALRRLLGARLGISPQQLPIRLTKSGKPYLPECPIHFSLSHSGDIVLCALSLASPVGVDIERINVLPEMDAIAREYFPPEEWSDSPVDFFRSWTRREAYLKALGDGIGSSQFSGIRFGDFASADAIPVQDTHPQWYVQQLPIPEGYVGAVCYQGQETNIKLYTIEPLEAVLNTEVCE
jgi:4'-phosphopantetheinyl transferase